MLVARLILIGLAGVFAILFGGVIFLGAFISDDETRATQVAIPSLMLIALGIFALFAVIAFPIWRRKREKR